MLAYSGAKVPSRFYAGDLVTRTGDREIRSVSGRVGMYGNMIKNPKWEEETSWLFTRRGRVESGITRNKSSPEARMGYEPGTT